MATTALKVSSAVFFLVGLIHLSRLVFKFSLMINQTEIPFWVNGVGMVVAFGLSLWTFKASKA